MRHRWHLFWLLVLLAAAPFAGLYYLAYTAGGMQALVTLLNGGVGSVRIQIQGATGTLAGGVHVDRLIIDQRRVHIEIDDASARLEVLPLAWETLHVPQARAALVLVHVLPVGAARPPGARLPAPHFLPRLMRVVADQVETRRWLLITPGGSRLDSRDVSASGVLHSGELQLYAGALTLHGARVQLGGTLRAARPLGMQASVHVEAEPAGQPSWLVDGRIQGNDSRLGIDLDVHEPFSAHFDGEALDLTRHWHWRGRTRLMSLQLAAWHVGNALGRITGVLDMQGAGRDFQARGSLVAPGLRAGALQTEFSGRLAGRVLEIARWHVQRGASGPSLQSSGSVAFVRGGPRLDLQGSWQNFRWPLAATAAPIRSAAGSFQLSGMRPFQLHAAGQLRAGPAPPMAVVMQGQLAGTGLTVSQAQLQLLGGQAQLSGQAVWSGAQRHWQLRARLAGLNVAQLRPGFPGHVSFALDAAGAGFRKDSDLQLSLTDLTGRIRGLPASGHGQLQRQGGHWQLHAVRLQLGATRLTADGRLGRTLDLSLGVNADDLALLSPSAHGRLQLSAKLSGPLTEPTVMLSARAKAVHWQRLGLGSLSADVDFDPRSSGRADADIRVDDLQFDGRRLEQLRLRARGTAARQRVSLQAQARGLALLLAGRGQYRPGRWQLDIDRLQARDGGPTALQLTAPARLSIGTAQLSLSSLCLHGGRARVCAAIGFNGTERRVSLSANDLPLEALTAGLTAATDFDGVLAGRLELTRAAGASWGGRLNVDLTRAAVHKHLDNGRTQTLELGSGRLEASLGPRRLTAQMSLQAGTAANLQAQLSAAGLKGSWRDWPLQGTLKIDTDALGFLASYLPQVDTAAGRASAMLTLRGTPAAPQLAGQLRLANGQLNSYQINLALRHVNLTAQLQNNRIVLAGEASAGPHGRARVSGQLQWRGGKPYGTLQLKGTNLQIVDIPEARIDASPDVAVTMMGRRIDVNGQVILPYARIQPADLAKAVLPSDDVVIVGSSAPPGARYQVFSHVTVRLGRDVTINTRGLSGRLSGSLTVTTDSTGIDHGVGQLNIEQGRYVAYGRNLDIQSGRLLFNGGLLNDPGIDLRAVQQFPDITAGVDVRGTLRDPSISFFSNPPVSQTQIVSLLLAGGSLETVQGNGASGNSRADMLMQGGAILAQQIVGRFGFNAGVQQDLNNQTSLVLGRYLSPRIYVSYGVSLAEAINVFKLRYTIGDHWTIKTEVGTERSADLVYTIVR